MIEWSKKRAAVVCLLCVLTGWMAHGCFTPSRPHDRPVLTWLARAARTALLFFFFADTPEHHEQPVQHPMADGTLPVDHGRAI